MSKVYMLKDPASQLPMGIFSTYDTAMDLASRIFRTCSMTEYGGCIDEWELDPLKDKLDNGIYPWLVTIDLLTGESEITDLRDLFEKEGVVQHQARTVWINVYAHDEEEAENKAVELWQAYQSDLECPIKAVKVFMVRFSEEAEVVDVRSSVAFTSKEVEPESKYMGDVVEVRVVADTIDEALEVARAQYDEWIDQQILDAED